MDVIGELQDLSSREGRSILVDFDGDGEMISLDARFEGGAALPAAEAEKAIKVAMACLQIEIDDFGQEHRCTGYVSISKLGIWLDGSSEDNDWSYERSVDPDIVLDELEEAAEIEDGEVEP